MTIGPCDAYTGIKWNTVKVLLFATAVLGFFLIPSVKAQEQQQHDIVNDDLLPRCSLDCGEHGTCKLTFNNHDKLAYAVQSGQMIQYCDCDNGYGGMGCDIAMFASTTSNGGGDSGAGAGGLRRQYQDSCSRAYATSRFAGSMCVRPYTEYCVAKYDVEAIRAFRASSMANPSSVSTNSSTSEPPTSSDDVPFCTNGGKCKGSIVSARVAPFNTTVNAQYARLGCLCPSDFYGPHCELLRQSHDTTSSGEQTNPASAGAESDSGENNGAGSSAAEALNESSPAVLTCLSLFLLAVLGIMFLLVRRWYSNNENSKYGTESTAASSYLSPSLPREVDLRGPHGVDNSFVAEEVATISTHKTYNDDPDGSSSGGVYLDTDHEVDDADDVHSRASHSISTTSILLDASRAFNFLRSQPKNSSQIQYHPAATVTTTGGKHEINNDHESMGGQSLQSTGSGRSPSTARLAIRDRSSQLHPLLLSKTAPSVSIPSSSVDEPLSFFVASAAAQQSPNASKPSQPTERMLSSSSSSSSSSSLTKTQKTPFSFQWRRRSSSTSNIRHGIDDNGSDAM